RQAPEQSFWLRPGTARASVDSHITQAGECTSVPTPHPEQRERRRWLRAALGHPRVEQALAVLIVLSAAVLMAEVWAPADPLWRVLGVVINLVFAVELLLRFLAEPRKPRFFANFWFDIL